MKERDLKIGQTAYVFITNTGYHWNLDSEKGGTAILAHGLGISDFAKKGYFRLSEIYRRKQRHIDAYDIMAAFADYPKLPVTFDGSLPSDTFDSNSKRLTIGETYLFEGIGGDEGLIATMTSATVAEHEKQMYIGTNQGQILTRPMSDAELADYRNHRDAFFGVLQKQGKTAKSEYEFFEDLVEIHMAYPRDNLLRLTENWPNAEELKKLNHEDLVLEYCESIALPMIGNSGRRDQPLTKNI
jgi:hypothetical protein